VSDLRWSDSPIPENAGAAFVLWRCEDCEKGNIFDRTMRLCISEGIASLSCSVENCCGPEVDSEMLEMDSIDVSVSIDKSGGTYEYPNDCNVWFALTPVNGGETP